MRTICVVTDELHPFTTGGIGRLLHNAIRDALVRSAHLQFVLVLPGVNVPREAVESHFGPRVTARMIEWSEGWTPRDRDGRNFPPPGAYTDTPWHARSLDVLLALRDVVASGTELDVVEFPDYRGLAFCTIQEKRLGHAFHRAEIAVRIHSTDGVLQRFESRLLVNQQAGLYELERKALHDADRVVAPLAPIARATRELYGFEDAWARKVTLQFPPVVEGQHRIAERGPLSAPPDLLFATKIQPCKRPDLFVRGAALFMARTPEFTGRAILACRSVDPEYHAFVRGKVPRSLVERFVFVDSGSARESLMGRSIVVVPSSWESLNLVAYEAAAAGSTVVLNGQCLAFGAESPFVDGVNCHKFDGTVDGLAAALDAAWRSPARGAVDVTPSEPYWLTPSPAAITGQPRRRAIPRVSVVIPNHNLGAYLPETIASVAASTHADVEVIIVDDASTEALDADVLASIERDAARDGAPIEIIRSPVNRGLSGARNVGIAAARGAYVLPLDADDCVAPEFIETAVAALEENVEYDVVVPTCGFFESDAELAERRFCDYAIFLGDVPSLGLSANRFSTATALLRRGLFERYRYDETLTSLEDWDLYLRMAAGGHRFLVTNDVQFYYRRRRGSMISGVTAERHLQLLSRMFEGLPQQLPASMRLFTLLIPTANVSRLNPQVNPQAPSEGDGKPLRYSIADWMNESLKRFDRVQPALKKSASWAKRRWGRTR